MIRTPPQHQTDPAKQAGQIINGLSTEERMAVRDMIGLIQVSVPARKVQNLRRKGDVRIADGEGSGDLD